jgi:hypothetical protein
LCRINGKRVPEGTTYLTVPAGAAETSPEDAGADWASGVCIDGVWDAGGCAGPAAICAPKTEPLALIAPTNAKIRNLLFIRFSDASSMRFVLPGMPQSYAREYVRSKGCPFQKRAAATKP